MVLFNNDLTIRVNFALHTSLNSDLCLVPQCCYWILNSWLTKNLEKLHTLWMN